MTRRRRAARAAVLAVMASVCSACAGINPSTGAQPNTSKPLRTYVAIGGTESSELFGPQGVASWTQLLYRSVLGTSGIFYDLASNGATLAEVSSEEVPDVRALHPALVTLWAVTLDLLEGVTPATYGQELGEVLSRLAAKGVTVLVGNAPPVQLLPSYQRCLVKPSSCGLNATSLPSAASVAALVGRFNAAISSAARAHGALVVDVNAALTRALHAPQRTGPGPFASVALRGRARGPTFGLGQIALSPSGAALVARAFEARLPRTFPTAG